MKVVVYYILLYFSVVERVFPYVSCANILDSLLWDMLLGKRYLQYNLVNKVYKSIDKCVLMVKSIEIIFQNLNGKLCLYCDIIQLILFLRRKYYGEVMELINS